MFDDLIRELGRVDGTEVRVTLPVDSEGYFERACPSPECQFEFRVHDEDWTEKTGDAFCPYCRHSVDSENDNWMTKKQGEYAERVAAAEVEKRLGKAMRRDATRWNRGRRRNEFVSIVMSVDSRPQIVSIPSKLAEPMKLRITCPECACRYAVIGAAFFCPSCGHNAAEQTFAQSITCCRNTLNALPEIRNAIDDPDTRASTTQHIIENGLLHAVTAFQRLVEALYGHRPKGPSPRRNAFQNIDEGSALWTDAFGAGYDKHLSTSDLTALKRFFQQRHLLSHTQGIVDQNYIDRSGDTTYLVGQRIVVTNPRRRSTMLIF